jgi:CHAT domain-containing protein
MVITQNKIEAVYLTTTARIAEILGMLQQQFSQFRLSPEHVEQFIGPLLAATRVRLHELYLELLGPVREKLQSKHVLIVPHESLHGVPFHALFDGNKYVIDSFTVSYAPSASIYVQCRRKTANHIGPALILGTANEQAPCIAQELTAIAEIIPEARLVIGPEANEKSLREYGPQSRMLHIASHGLFRQDRPMFSGIRLGSSYLTLYDLYTLRLPVDHITLSGCSTGMNVVASGDEVFGLMRGLLSAGARRLLLSLWDVNDRSTAEFMRIFYTCLKDSGPAIALQTSMQRLREEYPHPYYWAPFMLVGNVSG